MKSYIYLVIGLLISTMAPGQISVPSNTPSSTTDFLGWDMGTSIDLDIKHELPLRIIFATNNVNHLGILGDGAVVINNFTPIGGAILSIDADANGFGQNGALRGYIAAPADITNVFGAHFSVEGNNTQAVYDIGLRGRAWPPQGVPPGQNHYGVASVGCNADESNSEFIAVYGKVLCPGVSWAGYFNGSTFQSGGAGLSWSASDENLKTNVQSITTGVETINSLDPKQYYFDQSADEDLELPLSLQYGLLAQELETILPELVSEFTTVNLDSDSDPRIYKAINYGQLIPFLVAAFQERQVQLEQEQQLIGNLESAIAQLEHEIALLQE